MQIRDTYTVFCIALIVVSLIAYTQPLSQVEILADNSPKSDVRLRNPKDTAIQSSTLTSVELSWTSRDDDIQRNLTNPIATGDHVVLRVDANNMLIQTSRLLFHPYFSDTQPLIIASEGYNPFVEPISPDDAELQWFYFTGLITGMVVTLVGNFSSSNCDFMAWSGDINELNYSNNIIGSSMVTSNNPEVTSFVWESDSQELLVACYNHDDAEGWTKVDVYLDFYYDVQSGGDVITYDTYNFLENVTVPLLYLGYGGGMFQGFYFHPGITFNNFFAPNITQLPPIDLGYNQFNFTWTSEDRNQNDTNYYSVWLSGDSGFSYMMLAGNLSESSYLWDSSGYQERDDYLVKIRAYSLDLTHPELCGLDNPPTSYWPGDFSDSNLYEISAGDVGHGPQPLYLVDIYSPDNFTYVEYTTGNNITWDISISGYLPFVIEYVVYHNGEQWLTGRFHPYSEEEITISIDGLTRGTHRFTLEMDNVISDAVFITVVASDNWSQILHYGAIGISIGSSIIILAVIVLTIRLKKKNAVILLEYTRNLVKVDWSVLLE
jgi:hypothetical protein